MNKLYVVGAAAFAYYWWGQQVLDWFASITLATWIMVGLGLFLLLAIAGGIRSAFLRAEELKWERRMEADKKGRIAQAPQAPIYMLPHPGMGAAPVTKPSATYTALPPERYELL